jgi:hypothetical protein
MANQKLITLINTRPRTIFSSFPGASRDRYHLTRDDRIDCSGVFFSPSPCRNSRAIWRRIVGPKPFTDQTDGEVSAKTTVFGEEPSFKGKQSSEKQVGIR